MPKVIDEATGKTEANGVYVAGDALTGPWSVIGGAVAIDCAPRYHNIDVFEDGKVREEACLIDIEDRIPGFNEVELGIEDDFERSEASRFLHFCGCTNCQRCVEVCSFATMMLEHLTSQ